MPPPPGPPVAKTKPKEREFTAPLPPKDALPAPVASSRNRVAAGKVYTVLSPALIHVAAIKINKLCYCITFIHAIFITVGLYHLAKKFKVFCSYI